MAINRFKTFSFHISSAPRDQSHRNVAIPVVLFLAMFMHCRTFAPMLAEPLARLLRGFTHVSLVTPIAPHRVHHVLRVATMFFDLVAQIFRSAQFACLVLALRNELDNGTDDNPYGIAEVTMNVRTVQFLGIIIGVLMGKPDVLL